MRRLRFVLISVALLPPGLCAIAWIWFALAPWNSTWNPTVGGYSMSAGYRGVTVWRHVVGSQRRPTLPQDPFPGVMLHTSAWGDQAGQRGASSGITMHFGLLLGVSFIPLVAMFLHGMFGRRVKPGCCPTCGYDLRATPERCPECGRKAKP